MNKRARIGLLLTMLLLSGVVGCGDSNGDCKKPDGTYLMTFNEQSGDCGRISNQIVQLDGFAQPWGQCTGHHDISPDWCTIQINETCTEDDFTMEFQGNLEWNKSGSHASGTWQITASDSSHWCSSIYRVEYERQ